MVSLRRSSSSADEKWVSDHLFWGGGVGCGGGILRRGGGGIELDFYLVILVENGDA